MADNTTGSMTPEAAEARRAYRRAYDAAHRERINQRQKAYRAAHPEQVRASNARYWQKKALQRAEAEAQGSETSPA